MDNVLRYLISLFDQTLLPDIHAGADCPQVQRRRIPVSPSSRSCRYRHPGCVIFFFFSVRLDQPAVQSHAGIPDDAIEHQSQLPPDQGIVKERAGRAIFAEVAGL